MERYRIGFVLSVSCLSGEWDLEQPQHFFLGLRFTFRDKFYEIPVRPAPFVPRQTARPSLSVSFPGLLRDTVNP